MKKDLIYLSIEDADGLRATTCTSWQEVHALTFRLNLLFCFAFDFQIKGSTYQQRKAYAQNMAQQFQMSAAPGLSWSELAELEAAWLNIARRFGLIIEFKIEGIL